MMRKPLIVIKLGGSAITDKSRIYTPRIPVITRAAKQIARISRKFSVVLVHGAGSYGHIPVRKFGLANGFKGSRQLPNLTATKFKLLEWEMILGEVFLKHRVPLIPFPASTYVLARNGRITAAELSPFRTFLKLGCVPSTGGDIVPDLQMGFSIVSGDQLAAHIATKLGASKLIFGVDVDGIFDSNPKLNNRASLLKDLDVASASRLAKRKMIAIQPDVTGGMAGKLEEGVFVASKGIPVYFVNLTKDWRLQKVVFGQTVTCSRILPHEN